MTDTLLDRFLRYVVIDTQSDPRSPTQPSTEKQKNLSMLLVQELLAIGVADAHLDAPSLRCIIAPNHGASIRVAEKLGFVALADSVLGDTPMRVFDRPRRPHSA